MILRCDIVYLLWCAARKRRRKRLIWSVCSP